MSTVAEITTQGDFTAITTSLPSNTLLVLYFHTPWAAPCAHMATVLKALAQSYPVTSPPTVTFLSINAEELPDISEEYDVTAVPYVVLQRGPTVLESISGSDASKVRDAVERLAPRSNTGANTTATIPPAQKVTPRTAVDGEPGQDLAPQTAPQEAPTQTKEELFARLAELVKAAPVMLFMKGTPSAPQCGFSRQLVGLLRERGVRYGFFNILADEEVRQGLKEFADWPTFPQLWMEGELVGGLDIVKEEIQNDPDFLRDYAAKTNGAPAAASSQPQPATASA